MSNLPNVSSRKISFNKIPPSDVIDPKTLGVGMGPGTKENPIVISSPAELGPYEELWFQKKLGVNNTLFFRPTPKTKTRKKTGEIIPTQGKKSSGKGNKGQAPKEN